VQNFILFGGRPCLFFSGVALMPLIVEVDGFELGGCIRRKVEDIAIPTCDDDNRPRK
jgi:hypothetical protein